jgi:ParB family chromosome partitioning protein
MSRKNVFAQTESAPRPELSRDAPEKLALPSVKVGAVHTMGSVLTAFRKDAAAMTEIAQNLANADTVVLIDPDLIDPAPVRDRIPDPHSVEQEALTASIKTDGQRVPVLLRPAAGAAGRYITVYGHRRILSAISLSRKVRALIADIGDEDALVAQGQENNERKNTSFIEKCLFAHRLRQSGLRPTRIADALAIDKSRISHWTALTDAIPEPLIEAIGPAPDVGERRWRSLVTALTSSTTKWQSVIATPEFSQLPSDKRFYAVLTALTKVNAPPREDRKKRLSDGVRDYATLKRAKGAITLSFAADDTRSDGRAFEDWFGDWIETAIPDLRARFWEGLDPPGADPAA